MMAVACGRVGDTGGARLTRQPSTLTVNDRELPVFSPAWVVAAKKLSPHMAALHELLKLDSNQTCCGAAVGRALLLLCEGREGEVWGMGRGGGARCVCLGGGGAAGVRPANTFHP
jgi:hypothetical protein